MTGDGVGWDAGGLVVVDEVDDGEGRSEEEVDDDDDEGY